MERLFANHSLQPVSTYPWNANFQRNLYLSLKILQLIFMAFKINIAFSFLLLSILVFKLFNFKIRESFARNLVLTYGQIHVLNANVHFSHVLEEKKICIKVLCLNISSSYHMTLELLYLKQIKWFYKKSLKSWIETLSIIKFLNT